MDNSQKVFLGTGKGRIAFIGGSITAMQGWRDHTYDFFRSYFPNTKFDFINAGIGGTNSTLGAVRIEEDVFSRGQVDLLFLEYAVNDNEPISPDNRPELAFEGIIRKAYRLNPLIDIVILYFCHENMVKTYNEGNTPKSISIHENIAKHYNISSLNLALDTTNRINTKAITWQQLFSNDCCHPIPYGHKYYSEIINELLSSILKKTPGLNTKLVKLPLPVPLNPKNYEKGKLINFNPNNAGWILHSAWTTEKICNCSPPIELIESETPGANLDFIFNGTTVAIYAITGMDAGIINCSIDNGPIFEIDMFDSWCSSFHRPVFRTIAEGLCSGEHILKITISNNKNHDSIGTAVRIKKFGIF
jgi:sialidase-1